MDADSADVTPSRPLPTPVVHTVGADELFFSTTDARGIIRAGNSVFVRISRYSADQLVGSPHNIIRHPAMPAGAFHLMWERLQHGLPMGAYVQNMAADGGTYWVFATVTPLGDGYLSVRSAPLSPLFATVQRVYATTRQYEAQIAAAGHHRAEVARHGAAVIEQHVHALGFESYQEFMFEAVAAEVEARSQVTQQTYDRPDATGPSAEVLRAANDLQQAMVDVGHRTERYRVVATQLSEVSASTLANATALSAATDAAGQASHASAEAVLANVADVMAVPSGAAVQALAALARRLDDVAGGTRRERFHIALARLHTEMVAAFAAEVIDGRAPGRSLAEVPLLCDALREDVTAMAAGIDEMNHTFADAAVEIELATALDAEFRRFYGEWNRLAVRRLKHVSPSAVLAPIDRHLAEGRRHLAALGASAAACRAEVVPFEHGRFVDPLERIGGAAGSGTDRPTLAVTAW